MTRPPRHPARFSDALLPHFCAALIQARALQAITLGTLAHTAPLMILDPFAGTGGIHKLRLLDPCVWTVGVEIEPEWSTVSPANLVGDALALPFPDACVDVILTSPTYGNRLADSHTPRDLSKRRSYTFDLGRKLHPRSSGALQWGPKYRRFHEAAWQESIRVLRPGGTFVLNISDHIRNHKIAPVSQFHFDTLIDLGLVETGRVEVSTPRLRYGSNHHARSPAEYITTFRN